MNDIPRRGIEDRHPGATAPLAGGLAMLGVAGLVWWDQGRWDHSLLFLIIPAVLMLLCWLGCVTESEELDQTSQEVTKP